MVAALDGILTAFGQISTVFWQFSAIPSDKAVRDIIKVKVKGHSNKHHSIG
jgi:hypothetical protein